MSAVTTPTAANKQLSSAERRVLTCVSPIVAKFAASTSGKSVASHTGAHLNEQGLKYTLVSQPLKLFPGLEVSMIWEAEWPSIKR